MSIYENGLDKNNANFVALSPLSFIARAAKVHPQHTAVVHGERRYTWSESYDRCRQLASALSQKGLGRSDTISIMAFNTPEMFEAHYGVPMTGAVLHSINTRLDAKTIAFMLEHAESKLLIYDLELSHVIKDVLEHMESPIDIIHIDDVLGNNGEALATIEYESFIAKGDANFDWQLPEDEWQAISLNYTSGTTGNPKGVVYHHRGAYLLAVGNVLAWDMNKHPVYLWTLPMFHCNGWCFPWTLAAQAGTNVCLRSIDVNMIYELMGQEKVTHYCGAPIVHNMLANASDDLKAKKEGFLNGMVAAAPPPAAILQAMAESDFDITHTYGLTESYGPAVVCEWHQDWSELSIDEQADLKARQGVGYHMLEGLMVADPETLEPVPNDGQTIGEVMMRGNIVMKGYLKNANASQEAFSGGWFHTGDLAVSHPDGYMELKDRSKDIIISGGENISTIEIEGVLFRHPDVTDAAVVAKPDEKWGEVPCAFVTVKPDSEVSEADLIAYCREELAHFKAPKYVVFSEFPKTSTGKTQKYILRDMAKKL